MGHHVRDGFGQTETTAQVGNPPGQPVKLGSMGRPLPGYVDRRSSTRSPARSATTARSASSWPAGPLGRDARLPRRRRAHRRGDARRLLPHRRRGLGDDDGYITYVGRADDVFKASDYRISPFELECVLIEHPAVAEAAVVPSPDPVRLAVPKAFVVLAAGQRADAGDGPRHLAVRPRAPGAVQADPAAGVRRPLPKTISGKIRRVELREVEAEQVSSGQRTEHSYSEDDFPGLKT